MIRRIWAQSVLYTLQLQDDDGNVATVGDGWQEAGKATSPLSLT